MNAMLGNMKDSVTRTFGKSAFILKKNSPEILLGIGIVGMIGSAVLGAKATLKAGAIIEETKVNLNKLDKAKEIVVREHIEQEYTDSDYTRDLGLVYFQTGLKFAKLYGPSVALGVLSIAAILASHGIMTDRQVSLIAAYNVLQEGFKSYRARVIEDLGEDTDRMYRLGLKERVVTELTVDEDGKKTKTKKTILEQSHDFKSDYARFFDEASRYWQNDATMNLVFLKAQQNYANDLLYSRGHVFLNEVYDLLGIPRTKAGSIVGWTMNGMDGDKFVDFNIYDEDNGPARDFVNGYNKAVLLDFNVDGVIYDKI